MENYTNFCDPVVKKISKLNLELYQKYMKSNRKMDIDFFKKSSIFTERYLKGDDVLKSIFVKFLIGAQLPDYPTSFFCNLTKDQDKYAKYEKEFPNTSKMIFTIKFPVISTINDTTA